MFLRFEYGALRAALALSLSTFACACGSDSGALGEGALEVSVSGEEAAEVGFPFTEDGETISFADGWRVSFSKLLIGVGGLDLRSSDGQTAVAESRTYVADLHAGAARLATFSGLGARRWDRFSYRIVAPDETATPIGDVSEDDVERMREGGFNYLIEGSAIREGNQLTFSWGFSNPTLNANCTNGVDDTDGVVVPNNSQASAEITIHVDHLFWTTLGTERSELRFEAIAAAGRDDGDISMSDLAEQRLSSLVGMDGEPLKDDQGAAIVYNPESVRLESQNLAAFMLASSSSMGHLNGEGLCTVRAKP
ncbi:MAG TPA: hypothetical protein VFQ61_30525 [Polyangiaceae bacterium]|nr:hypothetical protein [Polyangiaceae bacterium]